MPEISRFLGIVIAMFYRDHAPAHFHAWYGEHEAIVRIDDGVVEGYLPRRAWHMFWSGMLFTVMNSVTTGTELERGARCERSSPWSEG